MYQPIMIFLKSGEVGFCTLKYSDVTDLKSQVDSISMSEDVDRVEIESHLPKLDLEKIRKEVAQWEDDNPFRDSKSNSHNRYCKNCEVEFCSNKGKDIFTYCPGV